MATACTAGRTVGSLLAFFATSAVRRISSNMSRSLLDAAPSVPMPTLIPALSMSRTGATPEASLRFEDGL